MIREATSGDVAHIVAMGERMAAKARLATGYDADSVALTLSHLIDDPNGILFVSDTGMIGGMCYPHPFNHSVKIGQEFFWYSEGSDGPDLLKAAEGKARELGASHWTMLAQETMRPDVVGRYYGRQGYQPLERSYIKGL
jgi:hypothetical protein